MALTCIFAAPGAGGIASEAPKNSRAAALKSAEREQRDKERAKKLAMTFEDQRLQFEKERAAFMKGREKR